MAITNVKNILCGGIDGIRCDNRTYGDGETSHIPLIAVTAMMQRIDPTAKTRMLEIMEWSRTDTVSERGWMSAPSLKPEVAIKVNKDVIDAENRDIDKSNPLEEHNFCASMRPLQVNYQYHTGVVTYPMKERGPNIDSGAITEIYSLRDTRLRSV